MPSPSPTVPQVARLTTSQIARFKRDGLLVLPGVIDPELCRQARDQMWDTIAEHWPRMQRDDPSTWQPFPEENWRQSPSPIFQRPTGGGDPYFTGIGHRMMIANGAEDLLLDIGARSLWDIAEQLMGKGEVVWPAGLDASGCTSGPCFLTEDAAATMETHLGPEGTTWTGEGTGKTEELRLPKTGPHWFTAQGTRGMYCTLPNSPDPGPNHPGAHGGEGINDEGRWKIQTAVYFDDLPPAAGGLHLWPGSHTRIWDAWSQEPGEWRTNRYGKQTQKRSGYTSVPIPEIKADTPPVDTHGPAGSVVLWHSTMLHMVGRNTMPDVIRQATIYAFAKTPESVPDDLVRSSPSGDIWRDWSDEVRAITE